MYNKHFLIYQQQYLKCTKITGDPENCTTFIGLESGSRHTRCETNSTFVY